ncbi:hypothetical protein SAMN05444159_2429 [Bradyrhizobium lablabi]|uniref:Uncharacterized protein n=1 Tax=Bradyrhizobium lablabi TaxID=722472 RepID=A0A1M6PRY5_9BRAD|nr:hypothetical protein SAMN05444159_2429 [Bradyrhizobium lablabi]
MNVEPNCIACNVTRTLISVLPVKNRHEMRSFECPECGSLFRLVVRREPRSVADEVTGPCFAAAAIQ